MNLTCHRWLRAAALTLSVGHSAAFATAQTIDFPNSTLASPPQLAFPFYTPGGGSAGQTVRAQFLCPDSFLATQNLAPGLVTRLGFSLAGQATYDRFELRAGVTSVSALGPDWTVNLPDQRLQRDLSHVPLAGGGTPTTPANQWVEFDLDVPFHWQPGQSIVVDLITHLAVPNVYLQTSVGTGVVSRAVNFAYAAGAPATSFSGSGCAFRLVFASTDVVVFGDGCSGAAGVAPSLASTGSAAPGGTMVLLANQALDATLGLFVFGLSRRTLGGAPLPLALGGGCALLVAPDLLAPIAVPANAGMPTTVAYPFTVPPSAALTGSVLYVQYGQFDPATPASIPLTVSSGGIVVIG